MKCPNCKGKKKVRIHTPNNSPPSLITCSYCKGTGEVPPYCEECNNVRWLWKRDPNGYEIKYPCPYCKDNGNLIRKFNRARIPVKYVSRGLHFSDFDRNNGTQSSATNTNTIKTKTQTTYKSVGQWTSEFGFISSSRTLHNEKPGFLLHGRTGTGKTHLLSIAITELILRHNKSVRFVEYTHLLSDLREAFGNPHSNSSSILKEVLNCDILAIDEIGKGNPTAWHLEVIDELISRSYNSNVTIIGTTNHSLHRKGAGPTTRDSFLEDAKELSLRESVGDRVFSRMLEMMHFWALDGDDWRRRLGS